MLASHFSRRVHCIIIQVVVARARWGLHSSYFLVGKLPHPRLAAVGQLLASTGLPAQPLRPQFVSCGHVRIQQSVGPLQQPATHVGPRKAIYGKNLPHIQSLPCICTCAVSSFSLLSLFRFHSCAGFITHSGLCTAHVLNPDLQGLLFTVWSPSRTFTTVRTLKRNFSTRHHSGYQKRHPYSPGHTHSSITRKHAEESAKKQYAAS